MTRTALLCLIALSLAACGGGGAAGTTSASALSTTSTTPSVASATNHAPGIAGTPTASVDTGSTFDFQPTGSDVDGDKLSYSITNKPVWAAFDPSTGRLTGTPTPADVGTTTNIVITVSDGSLSASLPAFQLQVTGTATLSWNAPTQNTDGTSLKDLSGYRVYYGTSAATMVAVTTVTDPSLRSYKIGGLPSGTWYFAISAVNAAGVESRLSNIGSKSI